MYDAIVVGLGGVGTMALRGLARRGRGGRFLGVEAHQLLLQSSSSYGSDRNRIYRRAHFEHDNYLPWIEESTRILREMEREHDTRFVEECGTLILEQSAHPRSADPQRLPPYCKASYTSAQQHEIPIEYLDTSTLQERYPQFRLDHQHRNDMVGILEPTGGFVRRANVMAAALQEAQAAPHIDIMQETRALSIDYVPSNDVTPTLELTIQTKHHERPVVVATKCVLVSLGAWTGDLFPSWSPQLRPIRKIQGCLPVRDERYRYPQLPTFVILPHGYGLPLYGIPYDDDEAQTGFLHMGVHGRSHFWADPSLGPDQVSTAERTEFLQAIQQVMDVADMTGIDDDALTPDRAFARVRACQYTMTPDTHFMVGTPAGYERVFCVAGTSRHGYKQSPALGSMMVDFALGNDMSKWNTGFCDPGRFGV